MAPERERVMRQLTDLRDRLRAELERKQYQLEGFNMAMKAIEEIERMDEVQANRDRAEDEHRKRQGNA
jgi:hypothetical protein